MAIKIVDLFAGPGGLGEGFSSLDDGQAFKIIVSAEMESSAHTTLRLRSFFRLVQNDVDAVAGYYAYCNGEAAVPYNVHSQQAWDESGLEARQLTLGDGKDNDILDCILDEKLSDEKWVLIGGPPCQAYSIVGRARNNGTPSYRPENDHRHFLYKQYLRIIRDRRPPVFVMENVKGILSARVSGKNIFHDILRDLADPDRAFEASEKPRPGYRIYSLVSDIFYESGMDPAKIDPKNFIVKSEEFGIPQARHRVILLGIRTDVPAKFRRLTSKSLVSVRDVIHDLPALRSRLTKVVDSAAHWEETVKCHLLELAADAQQKDIVPLSASLEQSSARIRSGLSSGGLRWPRDPSSQSVPQYANWYLDSDLKVWLNHEARSHMTSDLRRYAFAATYAELNKQSPMGHSGFSLDGLSPNHGNWETGKFADRFRVQRYEVPATTITSHIAKDGHYFIHPDPTQCRSLTVREAARLQTFPDNYFFEGNRTQQYHQVGNAVPPKLAHLIAAIVKEIFA